MNRLLVLSSFPAPYRTAVFRGLSTYYDMDVFFATDKDQDRNEAFFARQDDFRYYVLSTNDARNKLSECVKKLTQYNVVLAYDWYLEYALKIEFLCILKKIPYIVNCDGAFIENRGGISGQIKEAVKAFFIRNAACCFSSGKHATKYFEHYGAKRDRVIEHPFSSLREKEIRITPLSESEKKEKRKTLGLSEKKCVVSVGQFIYRKGYDILLEAWKPFDNNYQLLLIGGGSLADEYKKEIAVNKFENVLLMDFIAKEKVLAYLEAADLFVLPTREDVWGLVVNEALAVGTPVVTTDRCIAGMELVENADCGDVVPANSVAELTEKIGRILKMDGEQRYQLGINAISTVQKYTIENIVSRHYAVLQNLMEGGNEKRHAGF